MPRELKKNRWVVIEAPGSAKSPNSGDIIEWPGSTFAETFMSFEELSGNEGLRAQQVRAETSCRFKCWYIPGITAKMRLNMEGRIFDIKNVVNVGGQNRELEIIAVEADA